jgi:murein DD-endopeptidase MepM/ murein hydrolase activator NlpD
MISLLSYLLTITLAATTPSLSVYPADVYVTSFVADGTSWDEFSFTVRIPISRDYATPGRVNINLYDAENSTLAVNQLLWQAPLDVDLSKLPYVLIQCHEIVPSAIKATRAEVWILPGDPRPQAQANITVPLKRYQMVGAYQLPVNGWWNVIGAGGDQDPGSFLSLLENYSLNFVKRAGDGLMYQGRVDELMDYIGYNQPVLACGDGKVAKIQSGYRDNKIGEIVKHQSMGDIWGNYIVIDHGNGEYSYYAHLALGLIKVKVGQKVSRGMTIGTVGNSGRSIFPHLTFGFIDKASLYKNPGAHAAEPDPANILFSPLPLTLESFIWHEGGDSLERNKSPKPSWTVANVTPEIIKATEGE